MMGAYTFSGGLYRFCVGLMLFMPLVAQAVPISYQFRGEVTFEITDDACSSPSCQPAVTLGQEYTGILQYDTHRIARMDPREPFYFGGITYFNLAFDNFTVFGDNTKFTDAILSRNGNATQKDQLSFYDELPRSSGIYRGGDIADFSLFSDDPDAITEDNFFPEDLDLFNLGRVIVALNDWVDPYSNIGFEASIEDLRRVSPIPEPGIFLLFAIGLAGVVVRRKIAR